MAGRRPRKREDKSGWDGHGGYMNAKKQKLNEQFESKECAIAAVKEGNASEIFSGITIYVNGYTEPSSDELRRLMQLHGGRFQYYYSVAQVTHTIASNLADSKIRQVGNKKIVRPQWILDSIEAGRLLSCTPYQLYAAPSGSQGTLGFQQMISTGGETKEKCIAEKLSRETGDDEKGSDSKPAKVQDCTEPATSNDGQVHDAVDSEESYDISPSPNSKEDDHADWGGERSSEEEPNVIAVKRRTIEVQNPDSPKKKPTAKAGDANFVSEYYTHSRLHHISTWGTEFRRYVTELRSAGRGEFRGAKKLQELKLCGRLASHDDPGKVIMHIDMDCFFVSVGLLDRPELVGQPVAVTHSKGHPAPSRCETGANPDYERKYWEQKCTGQQYGSRERAAENACTSSSVAGEQDFYSRAEIASCSYEARKLGVRNGMFMGEARRLCPNLQTIPYNFERYSMVSKSLYNIVASFTHDIEAMSCDELFVDLSKLSKDVGISPLDIAQVMRDEIAEQTGCRASAGLGPSILIARLATRLAKPNGQHWVKPDEVPAFIHGQALKDLPGVGWKLGCRLKALGAETCGELQQLSLGMLQKECGPKSGRNLYQFCRGEDSREIRTDKDRKSVSAEINYGMRFTAQEEVDKFLAELAVEVCKRLKEVQSKGKSITLKLKGRKADAPVVSAKFMGHGVCDNFAKSVTLPVATDSIDIIRKESLNLLKTMKVVPSDVRGMGIQVHRLEPSTKAACPANSILNFMKKAIASTSAQVPETSSSVSMQPTSSERNCSTTLPAYQMLSVSQVDSSVLAELPAEIREEVEKEMQQAQRRKDLQEIESSELLQKVPSAGISVHAETHAKCDQKPTTRTEVTTELPNLSQIDQSFMDALPEDLRKEVMAACTEKVVHSSAKNETSKVTRRPVQGKKSSPRKTKSGASPKKHKMQKGQLTLSAMINTIQQPAQAVKSEEKHPEASVGIPSSNNNERGRVEEKNSALLPIPSLCGATGREEVRSLIKEWTDSTAEPVNEDIEMFITYLEELVGHMNLEMADKMLKYFYRLVKVQQADAWRLALHQTVESVQQTVLARYGYRLKLDFP
ncbi:PREDICTED: DNA repair protein REV1-like isoform X2 [Priapulus caudatus]|uniref:DNA repair protein REV1 n=1 Tax=Priapulus caudatus TaxID=37621 RepID=A0ABM1EB75_PRICU|nr:PREDICTED: DNA repair protein REV1-like isoform X2 [Priapulus caudatus]